MTRFIEIGSREGDGAPLMLDVDLMLRQGLLVQANSGGGKSWVLRRLAEQLSAIVPTFVVDVEGEFASLREKFPFFLVAREGGDAAADPSTAAALVRKLLELRVSAVFDLFDLNLPDRHAWLAAALEAMDQAPRDVWGDTAILIDEAHVFAPEGGKGTSSALHGMGALATRGRKRGFGPVDATQRLGKLNKDVAAELKNALVGWTNLDIDRERAREALGVGRAEKVTYDRALRAMEPGEFFAVGKAFSYMSPIRVRVGPVESTHPEPGQTMQLAAPPPPAKIRAILASFGDLPKESAKSTPIGANTIEVHRLEHRIVELERELKRQRAIAEEVPRLRSVARSFELVCRTVDDHRDVDGTVDAVKASGHRNVDGKLAVNKAMTADLAAVDAAIDASMARPDEPEARRFSPPARGDRGAERRMLEALARAGGTASKRQLATLAIVAPTKSTFRGAIAALKNTGSIGVSGDVVSLTAHGIDETAGIEATKDPRALHALWGEHLSRKAKDALEVFGSSPSPLSKALIAQTLGIDCGLSTFRGVMAELSTNGLIEKSGHGYRAVEALRLVSL
jgi:uncharacterized protein